MNLATLFVALAFLSGEPRLANEVAPAEGAHAAAKKALASVPGDSAFVFTEVTPEGPKPLFGVREHERFAIGSSFKLFVLGALAEEVNGDRRRLASTVDLRPDWVGPPHSELAEWPMGSPVTLSTLALKMISISDNTATDHLIHVLGRERIERQMAAMGHHRPAWNRPLLTTREMTMLRDKKTGLLGQEYQKLDEAARRRFLAERCAGAPDYDALDFDAAAYHLAEWYATPMDMARALAWLKAHTGSDQGAHLLRGVLAVETKLPHDAKIWPYVGFKGGSEDQLLCGNWLLKNENGNWYTLHVFCNSPREKVSPEVMLDAIETILAACQRAIPN